MFPESRRDEVFRRMYKAYQEARKNKRKTADEVKFELNYLQNLNGLVDSIMQKRYKPSSSMAFVTFKPVTREIFAAPFRDRIVHHFLFDLNAEWWDKKFIYDSYSCRKGKGTLFAVERLVKKLRQCSQNYTKRVWIYKFDIQAFFMSLPRKNLYSAVLSGLKKQFPDRGFYFEICKYLWYEIIMDDPTEGARKRGKPENWSPKILPPSKSLFNQPPGQGIVIGNLTSQLLSNIYLDKLDKFITTILGYGFYGRYVDDFYILVLEEDRKKLDRDIARIAAFLKGLGLTLHPVKRYVQPMEKGVQFIGAQVYPRKVLPSKRVIGNFRSATQKFMMGEKNEDTIISYLGLMEHRDSHKIIAKIFAEVGWEYVK